MGDGVLVYFGYPQAHEHDAERAVRAGLELIAAVTGLKTHAVLQTRVGIATGLVVVGDLIGSGAAQEQAIVGETPNLAARLQGIAEPDMVVLAEGTRKLVGNLFELQDLGGQDLKGIAGSVRAWVALRPSSVESRFDALHATGLTELVGREEELELLLRRWSKAKVGEGQVVLLSGAPHASYIFKHALIQDAAYSTMLRARRQQLHSTIAQVLEAKFAEVGSSMPEVVAQQFERAGQNEQAIAYWQRAGERDLRRFAMKESIRHYSHALNLVAVMPETTQRSALELSICLGLGLAHQIGIGPTAKESGLYYERALALSGMLPNCGRERFLATWGRWFYHARPMLLSFPKSLSLSLAN
jgi:hypothetical protein